MLRAMLMATPPALLPAVFFAAPTHHGPAMPRVIFQDSDGRRIEVQAPVGNTAMEAAVDNGVSGILAECGGACACATCHGYIAEEWLARLKPMEEMEDAMLDAATDRRANSRLLCQIELGPELDGLPITVADNGA
jgi:2Fe-2S ferredoxin